MDTVAQAESGANSPPHVSMSLASKLFAGVKTQSLPVNCGGRARRCENICNNKSNNLIIPLVQLSLKILKRLAKVNWLKLKLSSIKSQPQVRILIISTQRKTDKHSHLCVLEPPINLASWNLWSHEMNIFGLWEEAAVRRGPVQTWREHKLHTPSHAVRQKC